MFKKNHLWFVFIAALIVSAALYFQRKDKNKVSLDLPTVTKSDTSIKPTLQVEKNVTPEKDSPYADNQPSGNSNGTDNNRFQGHIISKRNAKLSFLTSGNLAAVFVEPGKSVKQGEVLAKLYDKDLQLKFRLAKSTLDLKTQQRAKALKDNQRAEEQLKANVIALARFESVHQTYLQAEYDYQSALISYEQAKLRLEETRLLSPYNGLISKRHKSEGEYVSTSEPIFEIVALDKMMVYAQLPLTFLQQIKVGSSITVFAPGNLQNSAFSSTVSRIVPVLQENSRTFDVYAELQEKNHPFIPGQFVEIEIK